MTKDDRNRREWEDPRNWRGPRWSAFYFGEQDTRLVVPKRIPRMGWTLNMSHPAGRWVLFGSLALAVAGVVLALTLG